MTPGAKTSHPTLWSRFATSFLAGCVAALTMTTGVCGAETNLPFQPGERLTFQVRWAFIPAAEAVLEIHPMETVDGCRAHHFSMTTKTREFIDLFYKVRDRIDAYADETMTRSVLYRKRQEGKRKRDIAVTFDWTRQEALYSNFGEAWKPLALLPGSFDPLSVFYAFRTFALKQGLVLEVPVTDGKRCVRGRARVVRKETIQLKGVPYETFLVEPDLGQVGGVF